MTESIDHFTRRQVSLINADGAVKVRELAVPDEEARSKHQAALGVLYSLDLPMPHATGGLPGKKLLDNAKPHQPNQHFYMIDLANAFPSVPIDGLNRLVDTPRIPRSHRDYLHDFIGNWATTSVVPGLPLGSPASPYLFNLFCLPLDENLAEFNQRHGITYTRYLDDLTFSAPSAIGKKVRRNLRDIVTDSTGMDINHAKSRVHSLSRGPVTITGVSLYPDRRLAANPNLVNKTFGVFRTLGEKAIFGDLVSEKEMGLLHGYRGAVQQLTPSGSRLSERVETAYQETLDSIYINGVDPIGPNAPTLFGNWE